MGPIWGRQDPGGPHDGHTNLAISLIAWFMGPTWGPSRADRTQVAPCWPHKPCYLPDSMVHGANIGPIWGWQDPDGPHVGPMNLSGIFIHTNHLFVLWLIKKVLLWWRFQFNYIIVRLTSYSGVLGQCFLGNYTWPQHFGELLGLFGESVRNM